MFDILARLYRTKLLLTSVLLIVGGGLLIVLAHELGLGRGWSWLRPVPWDEFGGIFFGVGFLSIWVDHFFAREQDAMDEQRLRRLLHEQAPALRDAVLEAFAANQADLERVATPDTLDSIISNSLALRLHDQRFASEIYTDIRDQAISATERWYDTGLSIDLRPQPAKPGHGTRGGKHFSVTVRWEYTTIPAHAERRFVCVSDRDEYVELASQRGDTSAWYLKPGSGFDASSAEAFELLRLTVNGETKPIRRAERKNAQVYTASIGAEHVSAGEPVTIACTYRTVTSQTGHLLFFDIQQPTRNLKVELDYSGCGITSISALDLIPTVRPTRIERTPMPLPPSTVRVDVDGWVFPRSGIAFVWTLDSESTPANGLHSKAA